MFDTNHKTSINSATDNDSKKVANNKNVKQSEQKGNEKVKQFLQNLPDVVCLSHLRWDFVYQRPQHLLSRFARHSRVFFVEEPLFEDCQEAWLEVTERENHVQVVIPRLPHGLNPEQIEEVQKELLNKLFKDKNLERYLFWYYTPMSLGFTSHFSPVLTIYDCMDELSAFKFAPQQLKERELELFKKADLVFTGGQSLYESKKKQHSQAYPFPSSIDKTHFAKALQDLPIPEDQLSIPEPRIGFCGVIDERMDIDLLAAVADAKPEWQLVMVGPVVKIDPADLPRRPNIHYLGGKSYQDLPSYLSSWSVAMLPFALNESTRFISPTKTPEYLAAGKPVVSTPIQDVVHPYGEKGLVHIAGSPEEFVKALEKALAQQNDQEWKAEVEAFLSNLSWDQTWLGMVELMQKELEQKEG